jgi:hypothetical protein
MEIRQQTELFLYFPCTNQAFILEYDNDKWYISNQELALLLPFTTASISTKNSNKMTGRKTWV